MIIASQSYGLCRPDIMHDLYAFPGFLNTVTLPPGLDTLRDWLLAPAPPQVVEKRQAAIGELAPRVDLRQNLEAEGRLLESPSSESIQKFLEWAEGDGWLSGRAWVLVVARFLPALTAVLFALSWWGSLGALWWVLSVGIAFGFGSYLRNRIHPLMELASGGQERFGRYAAVLGLLLEAALVGGRWVTPFCLRMTASETT